MTETIQDIRNAIVIVEAQKVSLETQYNGARFLISKHLFNLWKKEQTLEVPKGIFRKSCPKCGKRLSCHRYKAGEQGDAIYEYFYYLCSCGYEYCLLKAFAKLLHRNKVLSLRD